MRSAPVAMIVCRPAVLPVFDDGWKEACFTCRHVKTRVGADGEALMQCLVARRNYPAGVPCIDARAVECGAEARLRVEATPTDGLVSAA